MSSPSHSRWRSSRLRVPAGRRSGASSDGGHAHWICAPKRVFPAGTSFITLCASTDGRHWRAGLFRRALGLLRVLTDGRTWGPTAGHDRAVRLQRSRREDAPSVVRRGSLTFNGGVAWRQGCCSWNCDNDRWSRMTAAARGTTAAQNRAVSTRFGVARSGSDGRGRSRRGRHSRHVSASPTDSRGTTLAYPTQGGEGVHPPPTATISAQLRRECARFAPSFALGRIPSVRRWPQPLPARSPHREPQPPPQPGHLGGRRHLAPRPCRRRRRCPHGRAGRSRRHRRQPRGGRHPRGHRPPHPLPQRRADPLGWDKPGRLRPPGRLRRGRTA